MKSCLREFVIAKSCTHVNVRLCVMNGVSALWRSVRRLLKPGNGKKVVLGIESTFDDTGAAVVDLNGNVLGDALNTQQKEHDSFGGVDPRVAQKIHRKLLPIIVDEAMSKAGVTFADLDAVATATRPGVPFCLMEGLHFSKKIIAKHGLPFIPIHHMEAHMLTVRMDHNISFPFLTLLVSGGHCIICLAQGLGQYKVLGHAVDVPPGSALDKVAREMKMGEQAGQLNRGADLEEFAKQGDMSKVQFTMPMSHRYERCCDFSFGGIMTQAHKAIRKSGHSHADIAARTQHTLCLHIILKLHRAIIFCRQSNLLGEERATLVASGGVARNKYLRSALANLCDMTNMSLICPPPHLCVDNGIMIAWTGMEYLKAGMGFSLDPQAERFEPKSPLGENIRQEIVKRKILLPKKVNYFEKLHDS